MIKAKEVMKKVISLFILIMITLLLAGCNSAETIKNNISKDADNFSAYRKVTVINLRSDKILMEIEGYISIQDSTDDELAIIIKVLPDEYKMHYVYTGSEIVYLVEQLENTTTDPYHWKISVYAIKPEFIGAE